MQGQGQEECGACPAHVLGQMLLAAPPWVAKETLKGQGLEKGTRHSECHLS